MTTESVKPDIKSEFCENILTPAVDIYETADEYNFKFELPGVTKENMDITISGDEIEIRGNASEYSPEGKELKYSEYKPSSFYRKFRIGDDIDRNRVDAGLENGILTLTLHKAESAKPKKIKIH